MEVDVSLSGGKLAQWCSLLNVVSPPVGRRRKPWPDEPEPPPVPELEPSSSCAPSPLSPSSSVVIGVVIGSFHVTLCTIAKVPITWSTGQVAERKKLVASLLSALSSLQECSPYRVAKNGQHVGARNVGARNANLTA